MAILAFGAGLAGCADEGGTDTSISTSHGSTTASSGGGGGGADDGSGGAGGGGGNHGGGSGGGGGGGQSGGLCAGGYTGDQFDFWWLRQPHPARAWISTAGEEDAVKITDSGATTKNQAWAESDSDTDQLHLEGQRSGLSAITAGLAGDPGAGGVVDSALVDKGLRAIEWGLAQRSVTTHGSGVDCTGGNRHPANSFPCQDGGSVGKNSSLHNKTVFLEAAASGIAAVLSAGASELDMDGAGRGADLTARAQAAIASLDEVAAWLAGSADVDGPDGFFAKVIPDNPSYDPSKANVNQLLHVAVSLGRVGTLAGNPTYRQRARDLIEDYILPLESADGILPENGWVDGVGFDVGYQTVSIDLMTTYAAQIHDDDPWRCTMIEATQLGVEKLMSRILIVENVRQLDGFSGHNTRTMECGPRLPGDLDAIKGEKWDKVPWRIYQYAFLTGQVAGPPPAGTPCATYSECADELRITGQNFEHHESCKAAGFDDHDPYPYATE